MATTHSILVTIPQAANLLQVGRTSLYELIRSDQRFPPIIKISRCSRIELAALLEWIRQKSDECQNDRYLTSFYTFLLRR